MASIVEEFAAALRRELSTREPSEYIPAQKHWEDAVRAALAECELLLVAAQ